MYKEIIGESYVRTTRLEIMQHGKWPSGEWVPRAHQMFVLWWPLDGPGLGTYGRSDGGDSSVGEKNKKYGVCALEKSCVFRVSDGDITVVNRSYGFWLWILAI